MWLTLQLLVEPRENRMGFPQERVLLQLSAVNQWF